MRVFKAKEFAREARRLGISDDALCKAVERAEDGHVDADLGSHLIKQRVARPGGGRSGGFRTLLCHRVGNRAIFMHVFPKSRQANIGDAELAAFRELSKVLARATNETLEVLATKRGWVEVAYGKPEAEVPKRRTAVRASHRAGPTRRRRNR
jgi:hypothetical protein